MLAELLLELLRVPSVTGSEAALADLLQARLSSGGHAVRRVGDSLVACPPPDFRPTVLLVAHIDTVPPTPDDADARIEGDRVVGRGASDMKAGLAVALDAFEAGSSSHRLVLVAYAREEGAHADNELGAVLAALPELASAELAVVLEPTDLEVQLGCTGVLQAEVSFRGRAAHSARPWQGENALTPAAAFLGELGALQPRDAVVDGLRYRDVLVPTQAWTSNARNVVPDRFTVNLNHRFAPDRTLAQAEERVRELVAGRAEVTIVDRAPASPPFRSAPLVEAFVEAAGAPVEPKQAWTDVARFAELGVPALNYGPGLTAQAHQAGEWVPAANLDVARETLRRFVG